MSIFSQMEEQGSFHECLGNEASSWDWFDPNPETQTEAWDPKRSKPLFWILTMITEQKCLMEHPTPL